MLAVNEIATNSIRHGGGRGTLRVWQERGSLICEVRDAGRLQRSARGPPAAEQHRPRRARVVAREPGLRSRAAALVCARLRGAPAHAHALTAGARYGCAVVSESEKQRLNRNLDQLLQELRVVLPGVQVLFAFLLAVPFSARFGDVDDFERDVYFVALLLSAIAVAFLMAPSIQHRILFRREQKRLPRQRSAAR